MFLSLTPPLISGEVDWLKCINAWHSPMADALMYMISNPSAWVALMVVLLYVLFYRKPWQEGVLFLIAIGLCVALCDRLSSGFAKPFFARPRPTHLEGVGDLLHIVYNYRGGPFGFFSGHASNFVATSVVLCRFIGQRCHSLVVGGIVVLVIYSRLYLGVHFISDVLAGIVVGIVVGYLVSRLHEWLRCRFSPLGMTPSCQVYAPQVPLWLASLGLFFLSLLAYAWQVGFIVKEIS